MIIARRKWYVDMLDAPAFFDRRSIMQQNFELTGIEARHIIEYTDIEQSWYNYA